MLKDSVSWRQRVMSEKGREDWKCILSCQEKQRRWTRTKKQPKSTLTLLLVLGEEGIEKRVHLEDKSWKFCIKRKSDVL